MGLRSLALYLITPVAGRKEPAGVEGFGRATSGFLFLGLPRWQGEVAEGGSIGCQKKGSSKVDTGPEIRRKKASPKHVLCVSTNKHYYLDYKSSKASPNGSTQ